MSFKILFITFYLLFNTFTYATTKWFPLISFDGITIILPIEEESKIEDNLTSDEILQNAFENNISNLQVDGKGEVIRILSDDNNGIKHQRFILKLLSGQTLLIAHNIDIAPRIEDLEVSDIVEFYGIYEWNSKGGILHWTHRDPNGNHETGWLKHGGLLYY